MFFIHPMWDSEAERIGKRRCTPFGYALHVFAEYVGLFGLLILLIVPFLVARHWYRETLRPATFWMFAWPFIVGFVSEVLFQMSWWIAHSKGFKYDPQQMQAEWFEKGGRQTYRYSEGSRISDQV